MNRQQRRREAARDRSPQDPEEREESRADRLDLFEQAKEAIAVSVEKSRLLGQTDFVVLLADTTDFYGAQLVSPEERPDLLLYEAQGLIPTAITLRPRASMVTMLAKSHPGTSEALREPPAPGYLWICVAASGGVTTLQGTFTGAS